jgi:hypothetical protein
MCFPGSENLPVDVFATHPLIHHGARPFLRSRFVLGRLVLGRNREKLGEKIAPIAPTPLKTAAVARERLWEMEKMTRSGGIGRLVD